MFLQNNRLLAIKIKIIYLFKLIILVLNGDDAFWFASLINIYVFESSCWCKAMLGRISGTSFVTIQV